MEDFTRTVTVSSSGMLCGVDWQLFTDILGQHIGPISKGQILSSDSLTFENGNYKCPGTSVANYISTLRNIEDLISHCSCSLILCICETVYWIHR
jgi:hypothetical protein